MLAQDTDRIVTLEADLTSDLEILPDMLEKAREGADVVLASCYARDGRMEGTAWHRRFLSRGANFFIGMLFGIRGVNTYSSFYRVYRPSSLRAVLKRYGDFYEEKGFGCVVELLIRLSRLSQKIEEVPMVLKGGLRQGKSKMKIGRTIAGYARLMARNAF